MAVKWVAILDNDEVVVGGEEGWENIPGEPLPWRRFVEWAQSEGRTVNNLAADIDGHRIILPVGGDVRPDFYSLHYQVAVDDLLGKRTQAEYLVLSAHYPTRDLAVQLFVEKEQGKRSWIVTAANQQALAPLATTSEETSVSE